MTNSIYEILEERIYNWGLKNEEIISIYIVGSRAREDKPFDEYSDLDLVIFSTNPDYYLRENKWLLNIDIVMTSFTFQTAHGDPEKLVLFEKGAQVDFLFNHISDLENLLDSDKIPTGFYRGVKMLLDKTGNGQKLIPEKFSRPENNPITQEAFLQVNNMYCFASLYVAKQILRNEIWIANQRDKECKQLLLQMIEWHAKAVNGETYDTWHAGKFIEGWADKAVIKELKNCFSGYDQQSSWQALLSSLKLFSQLSTQVAISYHYIYPSDLFKNIQNWLEDQELRKP